MTANAIFYKQIYLVFGIQEDIFYLGIILYKISARTYYKQQFNRSTIVNN